MEINPKAIEASKAVNAILGFSSDDQEALLEVLEDYFTSSTGPEREEIDDSDDVDGDVPDGGNVQNVDDNTQTDAQKNAHVQGNKIEIMQKKL